MFFWRSNRAVREYFQELSLIVKFCALRLSIFWAKFQACRTPLCSESFMGKKKRCIKKPAISRVWPTNTKKSSYLTCNSLLGFQNRDIHWGKKLPTCLVMRTSITRIKKIYYSWKYQDENVSSAKKRKICPTFLESSHNEPIFLPSIAIWHGKSTASAKSNFTVVSILRRTFLPRRNNGQHVPY